MRKGAIALFLMVMMVGVGFITLIDMGTTAGIDSDDIMADEDLFVIENPTRGVTQRMDNYQSIRHTSWDDADWTKPWNQRWHNWSNYLPHYEQREFWLNCKNVSDEIQWLDDINFTTNGDEVGLAKEDLNETRRRDNPMNFSYPRMDKKLTAKYDTTMNDIGVLNFTINPMGVIPQLPFQNPLMGRGKELNVEVWVDTDGDFNFETGEGTIEGIMIFDFDWWNTPYDPTDPAGTIEPHVTNNSEFYKTGRQMEEYANGIGYWMDLNDDTHPDVPGDITGGRIWVVLYRTDNNPDDIDGNHPVTGEFWPAWRTWDLLIYCGYNEKTSWITLPYIHPKQRPVAVAGEDRGFPANRDNFLREKSDPYWEDPVFDDEHPQIKEGEILTLEGWRSYDPQDDVGRDGIGYGAPNWPGADEGEGNENIDDGFPEGEVDLGEKDTLQYRWSAYTEYGDQSYNIQITGGWIDSPVYDWKIRLPAMDPALPASDQWMILEVFLTVLDRDRLQDQDHFMMLAYKSQNAPVVSLSVLPQIPNYIELAKLGYNVEAFRGHAWILPQQEIVIQGYAYDPDPNSDLTYYWEFIGPFGTKMIPKGPPVIIEYFEEAADWLIRLTVLDGEEDNINTLSGNATLHLHVVENVPPVPIARARVGQLMDWNYDEIHTDKGRIVTFNGSESYDPDIQIAEGKYVGMPGFDVDGDKIPDITLKYQWDWGDGSRTEGWSNSPQAEHAWNDRGARQFDRNFWPVKLKVWDGGAEPAESQAFKVYVNLPPTAKAAFIRPEGVVDIEAGMEVTFTGEGSYDPNDDPNYDGKRDKDPLYNDRLIYTWDFGDGSKQVVGGAVVTHIYKNPNVAGYKVRLIVSDGSFQAEDVVTVKVVPANQPPVGVVKIEAESWISQDPAKVYTLIPITFDASGSYDPDGPNYLDDKLETRPIDDLRSLFWDLGDGNVTSTPKVTHTFTKIGIFTIRINMTDFKGASWSANYTFEVVNRLPVAIVKVSQITLQIDQQPVLLSAEGSYDEDGTIIGYFWEFGDGTFSDKTKGIDGYVPGIVVSHQYEKTGQYKAKLYVMDNNQGTSPTPAEVTVVIITEPKEQPIGPEVIIGGVIALSLIIGILSAMGVAGIRKRI